jgi:hypothetical protein
MKKTLLVLATANLLALPALVFAALPTAAPTIITTQEDLINKIDSIGNIIFVILLAVAGILLIISGFMFVTAGGNPENVTRARQFLINALIGVAIALAAKGMVALIVNILS